MVKENLYKNLKVVAFDFDGVLADSLLHNIKIINRVCRNLGSKKDVTPEDLQKINSMSFKAVAEYIGVPKRNFAECLKSINIRLGETHNLLIPFPGIDNAIQKIFEAGLQLIIVTHNSEPVVTAFLEQYKLLPFFKMVLGSEFSADKDIKLSFAMKELKISNEEIIMVGDSVGDIATAIDVNVTPIGVAWGFQKHERLLSAGAVDIFQTPNDIIEIIL